MMTKRATKTTPRTVRPLRDTRSVRSPYADGQTYPMHTDYSQNCVLVSRDCSVDGAPPDLSHKGPMHVLRQPGV